MFVLKSKYDNKEQECKLLSKSLSDINIRYLSATRIANSLVKTSEELLEENSKLRARIANLITEKREIENVNFDDDEIRRLISLCHPDKHNNSNSSKTITQKLLSMRDKIRGVK